MKPTNSLGRRCAIVRLPLPFSVVVAIAATAAVDPADAASGTWNPTAAGTYEWDSAGNWTGGIPNATTDVATITPDLAGAQTINLATGTAANRTVNDLNLGDSGGTAFGFTLASGVAGSTLIFGGTAPSLDVSGVAVGHTISAPIQLQAATVFRSNLSSVVSLAGVISNDGTARNMTFNNDLNGIAMAAGSGLGQFSLGSANTAGGTTGTVAISDVRVATGVAGAFGANAANSVTISGAGQAYLTAGTHVNNFIFNGTGWVESVGNFGSLRIEGGATISGSVTLQQAARIGAYNGATGTISGVVAGVHPLTKAGPFTVANTSTIVLSGANIYAGVTTVNDGILRLNNASALGNSPTAIVENPLNPGSADTNALQLAGGFTYGAGRTLILRNNSTANIGNARTQLENQAGNNTWAGNIVLEGGTNQTLTAASGTTLTIAGPVTQAVSPSTSMFIRGAGNGVVTGSLNLGAAQLYKTDTGTWTISTSGNTHGNIVLGNGTLVANNNNALNPTSSITLGEGNANSTTLTINTGFSQALAAVTASGSSTGSHRINGAGALDTGASSIAVNVPDTAAANELTITANLTGSGGITKTGTGNLVLNNTTTGPVVVTGGTLTSTATMGGLSIGTGTTLVPGTATTVGTITTPTLSLTDGTVAVNLGSAGSDAVNVTSPGGLTQAGTTTLNVTPNGGFNPLSTFYPVISYTGASPGTGGFAVGPLPGRVVGAVTDNGSAIGITATNERIVWTGGSGPGYAWDNSGSNDWKKLSDSAATGFLSQDDVIFNNDGIAQNNILLSGTINPSRVELSHSAGTYTLVSGTLSGDVLMPLLVNGGGTVLLQNANTYTGPTTVSNNSTLQLDRTTGTLTATSGISIEAGSTFRLTSANIADYTFDRPISGAGAVFVDPNTAGTAGSRGLTISGANTGFTGTWDLDPSGTFATNGTFRAIVNNQNAVGAATVLVRDGAQLWVNGAVTLSNTLSLAGAGFQEGAGGTPVATATGADGSSPVGPALAYGGIGAVRMENNGVLAGPITLVGDTKIMPYNATGTISGNITNTAATDDFVFGGGGAGSNLFLTGDNSALERIWVNGGGTAGTNQLLVGNNTTTGTLGTGDVILYQNAAAANLRFQRSDGYTLAPGQKIIAAHDGTAANLSKATVVINTPGAGVTLNGGTIDLSDGTSGGPLFVGGFSGGNGINGSVLNIDPGSTVQSEKLFVGDQSGVAGTVNQTGGAVTVINQVRFGHYPNNTSVFNLSGGSLTISTNPAAEPSAAGETNGVLYLGIDGTGVLNHSGGTISTPAVVLDNRGATAGTDQYNLSGTGILELRTSYGLVGRNPDATISLAGGTIRNTGTGVDVAINATNISATGTTTLDTGGASNKFTLASSIAGTGTLDTINGGTIEFEPDSNTAKTSVSTGTGTQTIAAILGGTSPVTKLGTGTTTLSAANTYSGATTVSAGRLDLTGSLANSDVTVNNGAALGGEGMVKSLTFGSAPTDAATLFADGLTAGALTSTGALAVNGTVNVDLTAFPAAPGTITVLNHGGTTAGASNFALVNSANYRASTFTVGATNVTLAFDKKALVWDGSTATWETGGTDNDWNGAANDNFFSGDDVTFDDTYVTGIQTVTMTGTLLPASITVANSTYNYVLTGGAIGGSTGLTKTGIANLDLGGANTFTGPVDITGGTVKLTTTNALGAAAGGVNVSGGGTLDIGGGFAANALNLGAELVTISGVGVGGAGAIVNSSANQQQNAFKVVTLAGNATIGGTSRYDIRGTDAVLELAGNKLTKTGSNVVYATVDGTITSGDVEVNGGTFAVWNGTVLGAGDIKVNPGGILELSNMVAGKFNRQITLNGGSVTSASTNGATTSGNVIYTAASTINNANNLILSGPITESGGSFNLVKTGAGTLILTGSNGLTGKVNVSTGILRVPNDALLGPASGADAITLQAGGRLQAGNEGVGVDFTLPSSRGITLAGGDGGFHVWTGFAINYGGAVTGPGNLTKTDGGTLNFTGTANHAGTTVINGGIWNLNGATIPSTIQLRGLNGTLNVGSGSTITTARMTTADADGAKGTINLSGGTINVTGVDNTDTTAASLLIGHWGANAASSAVNISAGLLNAAGAEMKMGWDSANVTVNQSGGEVRILGLDLATSRNNLAIYNFTGGTLNLGASGITANANKVVNLGGGTLGAFANWSATQAMVLSGSGGNLTVNTLDSVDGTTARTVTMSGVLSGPGGLVKTGAGTLGFSATNTYTGNTTVNGGTLSLNGGGGPAGTIRGTVTVNTGATLQLNAGDVTGYGTGSDRLSTINLNGGTMHINTTANQTLGSATINMTGASLTGVAGSNLDFFNGGSALNTLASATTSVVSPPTIKLRQGAGVTFTVADGDAAVDLRVDSSIVPAGDANGPLTKAGAGTMELTAANTYTTGTTVSEGKLLVNNASGSGTGTNTVTVASGAFLGGTGTLAGATTVNGTLEPGNNSVGTLNFGSTLALPGGSTYAVTITGASTHDKVVAAGALTANGTIAVTLSGYAPVAGDSFDIADASSITGTPTFNFSAAVLGGGLAWDTSDFAATGTIKVVASDPYGAWASSYELSGSDAAKTADPDGDGQANLLEFATNADPTKPGSLAKVFHKMHPLTGDNVLTFTVAVRDGATFAANGSTQQASKDQVKYTIEASNDLVNWTTVTVTELSPADAGSVQGSFDPALPALDAPWEWHTFRTDGGTSVDPSDFIRLKVDEAAP